MTLGSIDSPGLTWDLFVVPRLKIVMLAVKHLPKLAAYKR